MRILLPYPVERSTEINFSWAINGEEQEDCDLYIRKVTFYNNHTREVEFCPMFKNIAIEPYQLSRLVLCKS